MVVLRMEGVVCDGVVEDNDVGCTWLEMAHKQLADAPITMDRLEEGDVVAMWDRNTWDEPWPGRQVFVFLPNTEHILLYDADGHRIDEPDSFVVAGLQLLRGDNSFVEEWGDEDTLFYCVPTVELGLAQPPPPAAPAPAEPNEADEIEAAGESDGGEGPTAVVLPPQARSGEDQGSDTERDGEEGRRLQPFTKEGQRVQVSFQQGEVHHWCGPLPLSSTPIVHPMTHPPPKQTLTHTTNLPQVRSDGWSHHRQENNIWF